MKEIIEEKSSSFEMSSSRKLTKKCKLVKSTKQILPLLQMDNPNNE
jgi:hypothetical protein